MACRGKVNIKPLSVNDAWQGRRFKTDLYKQYEHDLAFLLPRLKLPPPPYYIRYIFGVSNAASDFDNPVKPLTDILQKKYGFNDKHIMEAHIKKVIVPKGAEFFEFEILNHSEI